MIHNMFAKFRIPIKINDRAIQHQCLKMPRWVPFSSKRTYILTYCDLKVIYRILFSSQQENVFALYKSIEHVIQTTQFFDEIKTVHQFDISIQIWFECVKEYPCAVMANYYELLFMAKVCDGKDFN